MPKQAHIKSANKKFHWRKPSLIVETLNASGTGIIRFYSCNRNKVSGGKVILFPYIHNLLLTSNSNAILRCVLSCYAGRDACNK